MQIVKIQTVKRLGVVLLCILGSSQLQAQSFAVDVVRDWGACLKNYVEKGDIQSRIQLDEITPPNCLVNDAVAQHIADEKGYPAGTLRVADYYNAMEKWKVKGKCLVNLDFLKYQKNVYTPGEMGVLGDTLHVVMGRLGIKGAIDFADRVMFFVRGKKITKIISTGDGETLGKAIEFYSNKDYNNAFALFRKLANSDMSNYMAQYYTAIMLLEGEGCTHIHPEIRRKEAIWWLLRGKEKSRSFLKSEWERYKIKNGSSISYIDYVLQFGEELAYNKFPEALRLMMNAYNDYDIRKEEFPFHGNQYTEDFLLRCRPFNGGLMVWVDSETGLSGYLNEKNEVVIPFKYPFAAPFNKNGLALVGAGEKAGFINTQGEEIIPCIYDSGVNGFVGDVTVVIKDGILIFITDRNEEIRRISGYDKGLRLTALDNKYVLIRNPKTNKRDLFDAMGNVVEYGIDDVVTDINEIYRVIKDGKIIYSCYKNWK